MKIREFEKYIKKMSLQIDDKSACREIKLEMNEHLMESYEELIAQGKSHDEAVKISIENIGEASNIGAALDKVHTPKLRLWQITAIVFIVILFIAIVFAYFYFTLASMQRGISAKGGF